MNFIVSDSNIGPRAGSDNAWSLADLGWTNARAAEAASVDPRGVPGRVVRADRGRSYVAIDQHVLSVNAASATTQPVVGDWVLLDPDSSEGRISSILERVTRLSRATALSADSERSIEEQLLATNVDLALVIVPATDPNPRRLERELLIADGATKTAIVLTKVDLVADLAAVEASLEPVIRHHPLITASGVTGSGLDQLRAEFGSGMTIACFGASGVGKSTLINALLGDERMATGSIREEDGRGRHTTVTRELFPLGDGVTLIDMPGVRSVSAVTSPEAVDEIFADVVQFTAACRFANCAHDAEPDCGVRAAVESGALSEERVAAYGELLLEAARQQRRAESIEEQAQLRQQRAGQRRRNRGSKHQR